MHCYRERKRYLAEEACTSLHLSIPSLLVCVFVMPSQQKQRGLVAENVLNRVSERSKVVVERPLPITVVHRDSLLNFYTKSVVSPEKGVLALASGAICRSPRRLVEYPHSAGPFGVCGSGSRAENCPAEKLTSEGAWDISDSNGDKTDVQKIYVDEGTLGCTKTASKTRLERILAKERRAHRRVIAAAAAASNRPSKHDPGGQFPSQEHISKRMKNRASVEKCRAKQRARLQTLQKEQIELRQENEKIKEILRNLHLRNPCLSIPETNQLGR